MGQQSSRPGFQRARSAAWRRAGCQVRHVAFAGTIGLCTLAAGGGTAVGGGHTIAWTPSSVVETVAAAGVQTRLVTFTSSRDLSDIAVEIVPELRPYVRATPSHFATIDKDVIVTLTLTLSAPAGALPGTFDGTLRLGSAGRPPTPHPLPLPIALTILPDSEPGGLVVTGRVLFDTGGPAAGALVRGSLASDEAIEAVQIVRQEQRALSDWTRQGSKDLVGPLQSIAQTTASPTLATSVPVQTVTGADGRFSIDLGAATMPARVLVEVSLQSTDLPPVRNAKWGLAESDTLDMGTIVLPDPQGAEMSLSGGEAQTTDGSIKVSGLPAEISRVFGRSYDPDETPDAFPGEFAEMGAIPLNSSVFLWMEALDAHGNPVHDLSQPATIRARVPRSQWRDLLDIDFGTDRIELPIYFFNESTTMWEQMGIGWLEDDRGTVLPEDAQPVILDGSFPREIFAAFVTTHFSWMNVDYAFIGPWRLSTLAPGNRNNDCFFNAAVLATAIARSVQGQSALIQCVPPGTNVIDELADGAGPLIAAGELVGRSGRDVHGKFFAPGLLGLHNRQWASCGGGATELDKKITTFLMAITIVHETAHWLCHKHDLEEPLGEAGLFLEIELFGDIISRETVGTGPLMAFDPDQTIVGPVGEAVLDFWIDPGNWQPPGGTNLPQPLIGLQQVSTPPLDITISLPKDEFDLGEEMPVTVTYTNVSQAPINVLRYIVLEGYPLRLEILGEGEVQPVRFRGAPSKLAVDFNQDLLALGPGAALQQTFTVLRDEQGAPLYGRIQSGNYQITAIFSDLWGPVEVRSNTITFAVGQGGSVSGVVSDATNLQPIAGATVTAIQNGTALATATSGGDGRYTIPELPTGVYVVEASAPGFLRSRHENVQVLAGETTAVNFSLSTLLAGGELRLVLTWGSRPRDLDAHLWLPMESPYHVYFSRRGSLTACPFAALDTDALFGFGPETITISQRFTGTYLYAVHQFLASDGSLATSGAQVQVFDSSGLIATFNVPNEGTGQWWSVMKIDGATGAITEINQIGGDPSPYLDTAAGCPVGQ